MNRTTDERGFSLVEAVTATVIAVLAVLGLAYTFSLGRGQVDRYEVARAALGAAESRMERLLRLAADAPGSDSLAAGFASPSFPFTHDGAAFGTVWWHVDGINDPNTPGPDPELRRLVVCVRWNSSVPDSIELDQMLVLE